MILVAGAANANRLLHLAIPLQRDAGGKNHDLAVVGSMNAKELASRLRMLRQFLRFDIKCAGRVSLLMETSTLLLHTNMRCDVSVFVSHCDVDGLANVCGLLLCCADYAAGVF